MNERTLDQSFHDLSTDFHQTDVFFDRPLVGEPLIGLDICLWNSSESRVNEAGAVAG